MQPFDAMKESPGATGIGAVLGVLGTVTVAFITPMMTAWNFDRNVVLEGIKGAKDADDLKARLDLLCERRVISGEPLCPGSTR